MSNMSTKVSQVTWRSVLANPLILGFVAIPLDTRSDDTILLISVSCILVASAVAPLQIPRIPFSASIACRIMFVLGCGVGGLALANILAHLFPDFPTVKQWEWVQSVPSAFMNLAILIWIFVILSIVPVNYPLYPLIVSTSFVAVAAGYALTLDALVIREAFVFDRIREITDMEKGTVTILYGCALVVWERLIVRKLISFSVTKSVGDLTLFLGVLSILLGIFMILRSVF